MIFHKQGLGKALPNEYLSGVEDEAGAESGTMDDTCSFDFLKPNTLLFMTMKPVAGNCISELRQK